MDAIGEVAKRIVDKLAQLRAPAGDTVPPFSSITTEDGTVIVRDSVTGRTASGRTLEEALADLRRLGMERAA